MSNRRPLAWSQVVSELKADRAPAIPGLIAARSLAPAISRSRKLPLVITTRSGQGETFAVSHKFDRAAIMTVATIAARAHQERHGGTWKQAMAVALKAVWQSAKLARAGIFH